MGSLKSIIDFIEVRSPSNPLQYYSIVNAQLSANERLLIFYHSLNCSGSLALDNLNKYGFFRDIPKQSYFDAGLHSSLVVNPI